MIPTETTPVAAPWYRYPWVWFVVGLLGMSVAVSLTMVVIAVKNKDDLVRDDWYKAGRTINQDVHADKLAAQLGLSGELTLDPAAMAVTVRLAAANAAVDTLPDRLQLALVHSTIASEDMTVLVTRGSDGLWHGQLPRLPMGKRHLSLEPLLAKGDPARWRLRATEIAFHGVPVALSPAF